MECAQARRFFLVRVIRHDVVEINLEARDVLFHGTSGSPRLAAKVCYALAKTKLISSFEYSNEAPGTGLLSSRRKMGLSERTKERLTCESFIMKMPRVELLTELNIPSRNEKFLLAHQLALLHKVVRY